IVPRVRLSETSLISVSAPTAKLTFSSVRSKDHSSNLASCRLPFGKRTRNAFLNRGDFFCRQTQAELAASPQNIFRRHRPFVANQVPYLSFREVGTQYRTQIRKLPRGTDQIVNPCAIGAEQ